MTRKAILTLSFFAVACTLASAQKYRYIDKTVASVGNEAIMISDIEDGVKDRKAQGLNSVFASDSTTLAVVKEQVERMSQVK